MLTLILPVAAYIPFIIFTINFGSCLGNSTPDIVPLSGGGKASSCSGLEPGVARPGSAGEHRSALSSLWSPESRKVHLVESVSRACFQKVQLHCAAQCFRRRSGLILLFL